MTKVKLPPFDVASTRNGGPYILVFRGKPFGETSESYGKLLSIATYLNRSYVELLDVLERET